MSGIRGNAGQDSYSLNFISPQTAVMPKTAPQALESANKSRKSAELVHGRFKLG